MNNTKQKIYIPVKDLNGIPKNKFLQITKNGLLHKKLMGIYGNDTLNNLHIIEPYDRSNNQK